jgi:hypothetical protein
VDSESKRVGRPVKRKLQFPKETLDTNSEWMEEYTCFGIIKRSSNGDVILPPGLFEEIDESFRKLSESMSK